jgi:hypothetical protein
MITTIASTAISGYRTHVGQGFTSAAIGLPLVVCT